MIQNEQMEEKDLWRTHAYVYRHFVEMGTAPSVQDAGRGLGLDVSEVESLYRELHARHAFFLRPGSRPAAVLMANPFSAVETGFRVWVNGRSYWANCGWDAFGIPAALNTDAAIEARLYDSDAIVDLAVEHGRVLGHGEVVHILLPFARWYDNLVFT